MLITPFKRCGQAGRKKAGKKDAIEHQEISTHVLRARFTRKEKVRQEQTTYVHRLGGLLCRAGSI